jgi:predicted nucleic-acid-binding protein
MKAVDTNILVRFLTEDEPAQLAIARKIIQEAQQEGTRLFICSIVLCELIWVLSYSYELDKAGIIGVLERLFVADAFEIERLSLATAALERYRHGRAGYADYLIGELALAAGCNETLTFDRKLKATEGFRVS